MTARKLGWKTIFKEDWKRCFRTSKWWGISRWSLMKGTC